MFTFFLVAPWFEYEGEKKIMKETGEDAKLECSAKGFPLSVEWKFKNESDEVVNSCIGKVTLRDLIHFKFVNFESSFSTKRSSFFYFQFSKDHWGKDLT